MYWNRQSQAMSAGKVAVLATHVTSLELGLLPAECLDISRTGVGEGGWLEGWLGCLLCLGGSERPCNTCIVLPCICITFPQSVSLIHPHMRHRQPHTFQQAPPATSPMCDMPRWLGGPLSECHYRT